MLIQLSIIGLLGALMALAAVWISSDSNKYRKLVWVLVFLTFDLIMFGAFTRLTDSGLGCPDWPGCYGHANPWQAHGPISAAEAALPDGPVTVMKAWIEMTHRYFAMTVGALILALLISACAITLKNAKRKADRLSTAYSPAYPALLLGFVCLQGAFGAWTVTMKLQPAIVTIHLLLGMGLLALLTWHAASKSEHAAVMPAAKRLRAPAAFALVLLTFQIALGGWVSTNYAAVACADFPLCHGVLIPEMDFANGFSLWRELGKTADGGNLAYPALTAIHWVHRNFAFVVVAYIGWLAHKTLKIDGLRRTARWLLIAIALQFGTGVATVFLNWPLALAVLHNGGAALLVLLLTMLNYKTGLATGILSNRAASQLSPAEPSA
jgi:cytochrome c oxidase assembly protein subunit 15